MHVAARRILGGPYALRVFRRRVKVPLQIAGRGVEGLHEAANAVFAAVGADQNEALDRGRRHRLGIALLGIGDLLGPLHRAGLGVQRDELRVERGEIDVVAVDRDAAIVGAAAIGRDRTHLVLVFPHLLAGLRVQRVDVVEGRGDVHHAVDHDRRGLERVDDVGLENPRRPQVVHVGRGDLPRRMKTRLPVVAVGLKKVGGVASRLVEQILRDRGHRRGHGHLGGHRVLDLLRRIGAERGARQTDRARRGEHPPDPDSHLRSLPMGRRGPIRY